MPSTSADSTTRVLLTVRQAAAYLSVSRSYFLEHVRPFLPVVDMKAPAAKQPMPRFAKSDLDAFWQKRRRDRKAAS